MQQLVSTYVGAGDACVCCGDAPCLAVQTPVLVVIEADTRSTQQSVHIIIKAIMIISVAILAQVAVGR